MTNEVQSAELPGMTKEDVIVQIDDDAMIIKGERNAGRDEEKRGYNRSERMYGSFERRIPLPSDVNGEGATALFRDGLLEVKLDAPVRASNARTITIER